MRRSALLAGLGTPDRTTEHGRCWDVIGEHTIAQDRNQRLQALGIRPNVSRIGLWVLATNEPVIKRTDRPLLAVATLEVATLPLASEEPPHPKLVMPGYNFRLVSLEGSALSR